MRGGFRGFGVLLLFGLFVLEGKEAEKGGEVVGRRREEGMVRREE